MDEFIKKYALSVFGFGLLLLLACLMGNTVGLIGSIFTLDVDGFMWHLERFTYYIPMLGLFMGVMYAADNKIGKERK